MNAKRATADELLPHIFKFVGSSGGGQWCLLCKFCRDKGTISTARHSIDDPKALRKAAEAFVEQGWWIDNIPICPKCYIRKRYKTLLKRKAQMIRA
ncbi:MAG TPA: hypothetical protein VMH87_09735 [Pseudomonadales bacterium]|nr:hypothetical protein [Pseudomonadales bacterium]